MPPSQPAPFPVGPGRRPFSERLPLVVVLAFAAAHLVAAALIDPGPDETYYWYWSRYPALGYYDHPPMVAWWTWLSTALFGDSPLGIRALSTLALIPISVATYQTGRLLFDRTVAARAAVWVNATLLFGAGGMLVSPDIPSVLFWSLATLAFALVIRTGRGPWWLAVGLFAGLGVLSKLTDLFLGIGLVAALVAFRSLRFWFARSWLWLGGVVALLCVAPMLIWNAGHDWVTFTKQFTRVGTPQVNLAGPLEYVASQFFLLNPAMAVLVGFGAMLWLARKPGTRNLGILFATVLALVLFLAVNATQQRVEGNWLAPIYPTLAIIAAAAAGRTDESRRARMLLDLYRRAALATGAGLSLAGLLLFVNPGDVIPARLDIGRVFRGWDNLAAAVDDARRAAGATWIATTYYDVTGELTYHLRDRGIPMVEITERVRYAFAPAPNPALLNEPGLLVAGSGYRRTFIRCFGEIDRLGTLERATAGGTHQRYAIFRVAGATPDLFVRGCPLLAARPPRIAPAARPTAGAGQPAATP